MIKNILFVGPPGSGKGTQINELKKYLKFEVISSGDIVRDLAESDEAIKKTLESGALVKDEILIKEVDRRIDQIDPEMGIVFDGFPRNLHQAEQLDEMLLHNHDRALDAVVYIYLDEKEVVKRLTIRKVCEKCNRPLYDLSKCPDCGGKPVIRKDDNEATIINRMQVFLENTLPLVSYYKTREVLLEINGEQSIEGVARDIKEGLGL
ncbi:MAG: nucleoside monophosphate kinase [Patescibacteria group bacterium]